MIRVLAVTWTPARPKTGKPNSRLSSTSRTAPSTMTPATPFTIAPFERMPPHAAQSNRPRWSITMMSPGFEASMAAAPRCLVDFSPPNAFIRVVTTRPTIFVVMVSGLIPIIDPFSPNLSRASDAAHASTLESRSTNGSWFGDVVATRIPPIPKIRRIV